MPDPRCRPRPDARDPRPRSTPDRHRAARLGELDRVVDQVRQQLPEPRRVARARGTGAGRSQVSADAPLLGQRLVHLGDLVGQGRQVDRLAPQLDLAGVGPGQQQQAVDQRRQPVALLAERAEDLAVFVGRPGLLERHLDRGPHRGQRAAQLVRGVGREAGDLGVVGRQPVEQVVDGPGQLVELVAGAGAAGAGPRGRRG